MSEAIITTSSERTPEERRAALAQHVASYVSNTYRVESQTDYQAIVVYGRRPNHLLHFLLSCFTFGLWVPVWIALVLFGGEKRRVVTVDSYGNVATSKGRG